MTGFLSWWDGFELWLSGLGFVLQTLIVMPVVLALAYGIAVMVDAVLGHGIRVLHRIRHEDGPADERDAPLAGDAWPSSRCWFWSWWCGC